MRSLLSLLHRRNPPAPRVFLHIGPHKTGTTTIQHILYNSGDSIHYIKPRKGFVDHHPLAMQADDPVRSTGDRNLFTQAVLGLAWKGYGKPIVFSSETFSLTSSFPRMAARMTELADRFHTELIITYRPMADRVYSIIQELVKNNDSKVFDGSEFFWEHLLKLENFRPDFFECMVGMGRWERCHVVMVDKKNPSFLLESFSSILGVRLKDALDNRELNQSIPYMQMRIVSALHREGFPGGTMELLERSAEMFERLREVDPVLAATPYPPIPHDVLKRFEEMDAELWRSLSELERIGKVIVHRPVES